MNMTHLDDIIWDEFERLHAKTGLDQEKAWDLWNKKLRRLGIEEETLEEQETKYMNSAELAIKKVLGLHQKNPDHVISYAGNYGEAKHHVYLVPKELATKIVVLGGLPIMDGE